MKSIVPVAIAAALMAGCSGLGSKISLSGESAQPVPPAVVPVAAPAPGTTSWIQIANTIATQIKAATDTIGAPVYVAPVTKPSHFSKALHTQIVTALVSQGVLVRSMNDRTTQVVEISADLVRFGEDKPATRSFFRSAPEAAPVSELIITTSLIKNSQYVTRRTDTFKVSDGDSSLYSAGTDYNFKVTGSPS